jgi:hypothetical protein
VADKTYICHRRIKTQEGKEEAYFVKILTNNCDTTRKDDITNE